MSVRIGLMRHGRTEWNRLGRLQGRTDIPLEDAERERLGGLALSDGWRGAALISSPLQRALETARLVAGMEPRTDARLSEMNLGEWEGRTGEDLLHEPGSGFSHVEDWGWDYQPPGGETPRAVWDRVSKALSGITEDTLIVSHMVVMRVILARAHDWDFEGPPPFRIKRDRIYGVTRDNNGELHADETDPVRLVTRCA